MSLTTTRKPPPLTEFFSGKKLLKNPALSLLSGVIALILGLFLVISHNVWTADWRVIITVISWLSLVKGVMLLLTANRTMVFWKKVIEKGAIYIPMIILFTLVGGYLTWLGFSH